MVPPKNTTFLIVDDSQAALLVLRSSLLTIGYINVIDAKSGKQALAKLEMAQNQLPVQFIISDLNMPEMDGLGLLRAVRSKEEWKKIPFVLLTAQGESQSVVDAVVAG